MPGETLESSAAMVRNYKDSVTATAAWLHNVGGAPAACTTQAVATAETSSADDAADHGDIEPAPTACTTHAVATPDSSGNASKAAAISAKAAARDAIAAGADPLIVVDAALPQIARFRELAGVSAKYIAQDPLARS